MNIKSLKALLASLPDEVTSVQFGAIEIEYEDLQAQQRMADEAELQAIQAREKELRVKLGMNAPAPRRPQPVKRQPSAETVEPLAADEDGFLADTDFGAGIDDEPLNGNGNSAFLADIAACRNSGVNKRRRNEH